MKKFFLALTMAAAMLGGASAQAGDFAEKLALYIPNRVVDLFDIFSVSIGVGPTVRAELMGTRACVVGAGFTMKTGKLFKDYNRQYGVGSVEGWYAYLVGLGQEDIARDRICGLVRSYWEVRTGFPSPNQRIYDWSDGARDYWQIGGALGFLVEGEVYIHPVDIADFVTGIFFYDLKGDDLTFDDFR